MQYLYTMSTLFKLTTILVPIAYNSFLEIIVHGYWLYMLQVMINY